MKPAASPAELANPRTQNESGEGFSRCDTFSAERPGKIPNYEGDACASGHSLTLLSLLDALFCPLTGAAEIECLAKSAPERQEPQALVNLWQSLGRPTSALWRETRVFYSRIVDSYMKPNEP